jgi:prevent-host-death family protein
MGERQIVTQTMAASEARQNFGKLLKQVFNRQARIIVEKGGIPVAALVSLPDLERWSRLDQEREERFRYMDEIRAKNQAFAPEEVERDVAEEIEAMRKERRERPIHRRKA